MMITLLLRVCLSAFLCITLINNNILSYMHNNYKDKSNKNIFSIMTMIYYLCSSSLIC